MNKILIVIATVTVLTGVSIYYCKDALVRRFTTKNQNKDVAPENIDDTEPENIDDTEPEDVVNPPGYATALV